MWSVCLNNNMNCDSSYKSAVLNALQLYTSLHDNCLYIIWSCAKHAESKQTYLYHTILYLYWMHACLISAKCLTNPNTCSWHVHMQTTMDSKGFRNADLQRNIKCKSSVDNFFLCLFSLSTATDLGKSEYYPKSVAVCNEIFSILV